MKEMMSKFSLKPKELKMACENEPWSHKARIVGFSFIMCSLATVNQYYFDMLVYRSGQHQNAALAGDLTFLDYGNNKWTSNAWTEAQSLDAWKDKPLKELKQINMDWKTTKWVDGTTTKYANPNGSPKDNVGYYTQTRKFYDEWKDSYNSSWDEFYAKNPIERDADRYSDWADMHEGVQWFDTAACWAGPFIGDVNSVTISVDSSSNTQYDKQPIGKTYPTENTSASIPAFNGVNDSGSPFGVTWGTWYTGAKYSITAPSKDFNGDNAYNKLTTEVDAASAPFMAKWKADGVLNRADYRTSAWDVDINVVGKIGWNKKDLTTDLADAKADLWADCDMDCQKAGSQLTTVGILMSSAFGVVALNSLFMFIGAWRSRWRVCSVYFTIFACMLQLILTIVAATMLFTKYNNVCGRSMFNTADNFRWTMNDDMMMTFNHWVMSLILLFPFLCCGMCSAYQTHT